MAKQRGIHQIKGKVGEMSYYNQKGVSGGLMRGINQGMSERVKTDEGYANTRLNNQEFRNANAIATAAFNSVNSRKRGMMRTFAIAAMTKAALEAIKQGTGAWGARVPDVEFDELICNLLESHAKSGKYDGEYGQITDVELSSEGQITGSLVISSERVNELKQLGIDGLQIVISKCLAGEIIVDDLPRLFAGAGVLPLTPVIFTPSSQEVTITLSGSVATPSSVGMSPAGYTFAQSSPTHGFYLVASILPLRQQGANRYVLQEYCTYFAVPLGQINEA